MSKEIVKRVNTSNKIEAASKKRRGKIEVIEEIRDPSTGLSRAISNRFVEELAIKLVEWAKRDDALLFQQFFNEQGILSERFYAWCNKYDYLMHAKKFALGCLHARREIGGLKREMSEKMVMFTMPQYSQEWKDLEEWRATLRNQEEEKGGTKIVVIDKFTKE